MPTACSPTSPTTGCCRAIEQPLSAVTSTAAGRRADACDTLDALAHEHFDRVVADTTLAERAARPATAPPDLTEPVTDRLRARGVDALWSHQAAAVEALRAGRNVVVATGTASGKSLCYQLPIVDSVVTGSRDTALLVFPTKALAQDQLRSFREWLVPALAAATYDGDTPTDERGVDPNARERRADQPRDAAHGHPPHP